MTSDPQNGSLLNSKKSKGELTRLRILESALYLFNKEGFSDVTLQDIAKKSKTSHPLILKHFGSKQELLRAVRKYVSLSNHSWVDSKIQPQMNGYEALITHCFENINWAFHNPAEAKIILLSYYYNTVDQDNKKTGTSAIRLGTERIHKYVLQAEREGVLKPDFSSTFVSEMCSEVTIGLFTKMLTNREDQQKKLPGSYKKKLTLVFKIFFKS